MPASNPPLFWDTHRLHEGMAKDATRSHANLIRTFNKGLADLTASGLLTSTDGRTWRTNGVPIAKFGDYEDSYGRSHKCIYFGSWLCLAMAFKVSKEETREALLDLLKKHPIYAGD